MDVVDLDELAADAVGEPGRSRRWQRRLPGRRPLAAVSGALVLALLTAGAIVASRDPLRVQVEGMRDGPRVGWSSPQGLSEFVAVDGGRVVTSDDLTIRARRADNGAELWSVDRGALGLTSVSELRDLPGTPWVLVGAVTSNALATSLVLLDRGTGRIAHRMELPAATATVDDLTGPILDNLMVPTLVATGQGALFALLPTQDGGRLEVAKLASPNIDDVVWRAELPMSPDAFPLGDPHAEERAGHLLLGRGEQGWPGRYVAALTLADGAPVEWLPDGASFDVYGDIAVLAGMEDLVAHDLRTGDELWRRPAAILAGTDDGLIAEVGDGRLTLVSPRTGTELWSVPVADEWLSVTRWGDAVVAYAGQQSTFGMDDGAAVFDLPGTPWVAAGTSRGWPERTSVALLDRATGRVERELELPVAAETLEDLSLDTTLFSASDGTLLLAVPTRTGMSVVKLNSPDVEDAAWRAELPVTDEVLPWWGPQAVARGAYLLIGDSRGGLSGPGQFMFALRISDGEVAEWLPRGSRAIVHGEVAVVESGDTRIAYDLATGEELWRRSGGYLLATHDGVIAEVSDGRLSLLSPRTGAELWSVPSEEEWLSLTRWGDDIVVYQGSFGVVSTGDGSPLGAVAALDLATGRERWRRDLGATVTELARGEGQLVALVYKSVAPDEIAGGLVGLDPGTGRTRWDQGLEPNRWSVRFGTRMIQATGEADYAVLR